MSKPNLILHIGSGKTGSSTIQSFLKENYKNFKDKNILIPDGELRLSRHISGNHVFATQKLMFDGIDSVTSAFEKLVENASDDQILISAENICNKNNHLYFSKIAEKYSIKIIFYIRRQDDLFSSAWQQWYSKQRDDFTTWFREGGNKLAGNYQQTLEGWANLIGPENISVRVFSRNEFIENDLLVDFWSFTGIDTSAKNDFNFDIKNQNHSYSEVITSIVQGNKSIFDNAHDSEFYKFVDEMTGDQFHKSLNYSLLSRTTREEIIQFFADQNEWVRSTFFPGRKSLFAPINHDKYTYLNEIDLEKKQLEFIVSLLFGMYKNLKR